MRSLGTVLALLIGLCVIVLVAHAEEDDADELCVRLERGVAKALAMGDPWVYDILLSGNAFPVGCSQPAPEVNEEPARSVSVNLKTSSTSRPVLIATVKANHRVETQGAALYVNVDGLWYTLTSDRPLRAGVAVNNFGPRPLFSWQKVREVVFRTIHDDTARTFVCAEVEDEHATSGQYDCAVAEERTVQSLSSVDDPSLWVYVSNDPEITVQVRANVKRAGTVAVEAIAGHGGCREYLTRNDVVGLDVTQPLASASNCNGRQGFSDRLGHTIVANVEVAATGLAPLRCEKHEDTNEARSVFACEQW